MYDITENGEGMEVEKKEVLLLFSGGRDSMLAAARLVADGYTVNLITFDNGCIHGVEDRECAADILKGHYNDGDDKGPIKDLGIRNICGIWQMIMRPIQNMSFTAMAGDYSAMSMSQTHCLGCRTAMVASAGIICELLGIDKLAVGDKMGDEFASQHTSTYDLHKQMLNDMFKVEYIRPVWDVEDAFETKSELMLRGLPTKVVEPQCVLGCPVDDSMVDSHIADNACAAMFSSVLYPVVEKAKNSWKNVLKI